MTRIDYRDSRPVYEQIVAGFQKLILTGAYETDAQMPSVRQTAVELSTNPNTVQKAYAELERQGYIYSVKGRGSFVCEKDALLEKQKTELAERLRSIFDEADELGISRDELLKRLPETKSVSPAAADRQSPENTTTAQKGGTPE